MSYMNDLDDQPEFEPEPEQSASDALHETISNIEDDIGTAQGDIAELREDREDLLRTLGELDAIVRETKADLRILSIVAGMFATGVLVTLILIATRH